MLFNHCVLWYTFSMVITINAYTMSVEQKNINTNCECKCQCGRDQGPLNTSPLHSSNNYTNRVPIDELWTASLSFGLCWQRYCASVIRSIHNAAAILEKENMYKSCQYIPHTWMNYRFLLAIADRCRRVKNNQGSSQITGNRYFRCYFRQFCR